MSATTLLVLLDRDGTINRKPPESDYVKTPADLEILDGAREAIARLNAAGVPVALVTNQRGIATGRMTAADVDAVHERLADELAGAGAHLDAIFVCPHDRRACGCRKPAPGLLVAAMERFAVTAGAAVMVGDAESDIEAGRRAGTRTIQLTAADSRDSSADATAPDLRSAVRLLLD